VVMTSLGPFAISCPFGLVATIMMLTINCLSQTMPVLSDGGITSLVLTPNTATFAIARLWQRQRQPSSIRLFTLSAFSYTLPTPLPASFIDVQAFILISIYFCFSISIDYQLLISYLIFPFFIVSMYPIRY
jgi:hypothetical protein